MFDIFLHAIFSSLFNMSGLLDRLSEPLIDHNLAQIRRDSKKLRRIHYSNPKKDFFWGPVVKNILWKNDVFVDVIFDPIILLFSQNWLRNPIFPPQLPIQNHL